MEEINKIIRDLGENFKNDREVIQDLYDEVSSIASQTSHLCKDDRRLYPYIKKAVKSMYLIRGSEGVSSLNESGVTSSFDDIVDNLRNDIIKAGLRRII